MGQFILDETDVIDSFETKDKLELMAGLQGTISKLQACEQRMRAMLIETYDCELGKSKTKTDKALGYKIVSKRPLGAKLNKDALPTLLSELGERAEDILTIEYKLSATKLKEEATEQEAELIKDNLIHTPGSINVSVTKLEV